MAFKYEVLDFEAMMIRGNYYGWDDSLILQDIYRERLNQRRHQAFLREQSTDLSDMGMLYLKSFLNNLDDHNYTDTDHTLAFARAFLVEVAC